MRRGDTARLSTDVSPAMDREAFGNIGKHVRRLISESKVLLAQVQQAEKAINPGVNLISKESESVRSWLLTANSHRKMILQLALAGEGVVRLLDWTNLDEMASGRLVRVLPDWESPEAPPVSLLFRPSVRRIARVRLLIDFVTELFAQLEARRGQALAATDAPYWVGRRYGRSSAMLTRQR